MPPLADQEEVYMLEEISKETQETIMKEGTND